MNENVVNNYAKLKLSLLFCPIILLSLIGILLFYFGVFHTREYVSFKKEDFILINHFLSKFPSLMYEFTQFGDALIFFSLLSILFIRAPKVFESLVIASIISVLACFILKHTFSVPRPILMIPESNFTIIGKKLSGYNSFPSGHSTTVFITLAILMHAFAPKKVYLKYAWYLLVVIVGLCLVFTRVGVGAHYPIDVLIGSIMGYMIGLLGIFLNRKFSLWKWSKNKKAYLLLTFILITFAGVLITKILKDHLYIYDISLLVLIIASFQTTRLYVKQQN